MLRSDDVPPRWSRAVQRWGCAGCAAADFGRAPPSSKERVGCTTSRDGVVGHCARAPDPVSHPQAARTGSAEGDQDLRACESASNSDPIVRPRPSQAPARHSSQTRPPSSRSRGEASCAVTADRAPQSAHPRAPSPSGETRRSRKRSRTKPQRNETFCRRRSANGRRRPHRRPEAHPRRQPRRRPHAHPNRQDNGARGLAPTRRLTPSATPRRASRPPLRIASGTAARPCR